ncbi:HDIG domain-containing protein [bacterium]|nr:HDIG domain-containing protein [bacterium]
MTKFLDFISSKNFRNGLCFVLFTFLMTVMISSQNYFFQKVIKNGISQKDIVAQRDIKVIDTKKTELHKKEAAQNIEPILTQADDEFITTNLTTLRNSVMKIRGKEASEETKEDELKVLFDESGKRGLVEFLLKSSDNDLNAVFEKAQLSLNSILNAGISTKDFENNTVNSIITKNIPHNIPRYQSTLIAGILNQVIVPNLVVDEFATEIAKKNAQNSVKPYEVIFKKGQKIVFEGEPVTKLKRDALRAAGYNVLEVNWGGILGLWLLISFFTFVFLQYQKNFEKQYFNAKYMTITASFTLTLGLISALLPTGASPYIMPIPAYTILLSIFTTPRSAFFCSSMVLALIAVGMHWNIEVIITFMLLNTVVMTAASKLTFSKRSDLLIVSAKITLAGIMISGGIYILEKFMMDIDNALIIEDVGLMIINCFLISGVLILGILPIIENMFGIMTPYGLAELADHNQELLKKLMQDAPGTFNHSLTVSHMCETTAEAIGANPVLAKVGAMYHDVGKLKRPMFFVENQSFYGIDNPHNSCTPRFSKMLITAHPKDGVDLAKDAKLPQVINNFILQHHGTSLVSYFYNEALKEEGAENVNEEQFRYPGPKPNMKETAILMIADAVESAVRAAKNPSNEEIDAIIDKIIKERLNDGQLAESPLTLRDIKIIGDTFSRMLRGMHHKRIKYHNDLVQELDKNKVSHEKHEMLELTRDALDVEMEAKVKELENKKNGNN